MSSKFALLAVISDSKSVKILPEMAVSRDQSNLLLDLTSAYLDKTAGKVST